MSQVYRERDVRYTREQSPSSDDEKYKNTTIRRYKVSGGKGGNRVVERDRIERFEEDDDRRSKYSHSNIGRSSADMLEIDRRVERSYPDRPRSAIDQHDRYEREPYPERRTRVVEEIRETTSPSPRDNYWERHPSYPWDDGRETDIRFDKRVVRKEPDGDIQVKEKFVDEHRDEPRDYKERDFRIERRVFEEREPHEVDIERYRKETQYYAAPSPPPAPVVIRQKAPEQKVVIHEAPAPAPVYLPRQEPTYIVLRDQRREVEHRPERREEDDYQYRRRRDDRQYESDGYDEDYYVKRTVIKRERSSSSDHHRRRHLAEGALAGAGLTALLAGRGGGRDSEYHEHRGRKVLAGAALGALGTEAVRRAKSAYQDRYEDRYEDDYEDDDHHRHGHRSKSRSRLATGLAIGAAALAVAGGLKYMQGNKVEKEEANRGRARRRHSDDEYSRSRSRSQRSRTRSKSSKSNMAKAALATSAVAGIVEHHRSKSRGKSRSKSRLRTGAEIAAAGLTGAAAEKLWERHKEKKEREHDRELDEEYSDRDRSYSRSRSHSRSRSRHSHSRDSTADRELGLVPVIPGVEYGSEPLEEYESASNEPRRRRDRRRRRSASGSDRETQKKRSRSRLREVAAAGIGTAAAAIGIKKYNDRRKSKERDEKSRDRSHDRSLPDTEDRDRDRERRKARRSRDRERRRYEEEVADDPYYYDPEAPPSPPHASGGAYYPPPPTQPTPPPAGPATPGGFMQHSNLSTPNVNAYNPYPPYNPQDYAGSPPMNLPPPPPGPPPAGPPPPGSGYRPGPENVSRPRSGDIQSHPDASRSTATEQDGVRHRTRSPSSSSTRGISSGPSPNSRVKFGPLSPKSSQTLRRHRQQTDDRSLAAAVDDEDNIDEELARLSRPRNSRRRSGSDASFNRPRVRRRRRRRDESPASDEGEIEYLPDRFDASGRPLDTDDNYNSSRSINEIPKQGNFEYASRDGDNLHVRGAWRTIGEPDPALVTGLAQTFGELLRPAGGLVGILGHALQDVGSRNEVMR